MSTADLHAPRHGTLAPPAAAPAPAPRLRVVPVPRRRAPRLPFALLVAALLTGGLLCLLLLNTALAQGAFVTDRLETRSEALADREEALSQELAQLESPSSLAQRAAALGMVPSGAPVFIRAADGAVLGVPEPAQAPPAPPRPAADPDRAVAAAAASTEATEATEVTGGDR
jgi:cell division protein FtsB